MVTDADRPPLQICRLYAMLANDGQGISYLFLWHSGFSLPLFTKAWTRIQGVSLRNSGLYGPIKSGDGDSYASPRLSKFTLRPSTTRGWNRQR